MTGLMTKLLLKINIFNFIVP